MTDQFANIWVEKYRPRSLQDVILSDEDRSLLESFRDKQEIPHLLFTGTPGTGKSSTALILVKDVLDCSYLYLNASDESGIDTIRGKVVNFSRTKSFDGKKKVVLLDEADGIGFVAMGALRNVMEEYSDSCRFILTCNYLYKVLPAIQSRCQIIQLIPPTVDVTKRVLHILKEENITIPADQKPALLDLIKTKLPDMRRVINDIQKFSHSGTLYIKEQTSAEVATQVFASVRDRVSLANIRKEILTNEKEFSSDFHQFQQQLFNVCFQSDIKDSVKAEALIAIADGMRNDAFVLDKEINCFATVVRLWNLLA